jgi:hypothetical protein
MSNGNTWEFVRRAQLARLVETLNDVLAILRLDQQCAWTAQFEQFLQTAKHFSDAGFTQAELVEFSHSVGRIFDPYDGGFRNYRPPAGLPAEAGFPRPPSVAGAGRLRLDPVGGVRNRTMPAG